MSPVSRWSPSWTTVKQGCNIHFWKPWPLACDEYSSESESYYIDFKSFSTTPGSFMFFLHQNVNRPLIFLSSNTHFFLPTYISSFQLIFLPSNLYFFSPIYISPFQLIFFHSNLHFFLLTYISSFQLKFLPSKLHSCVDEACLGQGTYDIDWSVLVHKIKVSQRIYIYRGIVGVGELARGNGEARSCSYCGYRIFTPSRPHTVIMSCVVCCDVDLCNSCVDMEILDNSCWLSLQLDGHMPVSISCLHLSG